MYNYPFTTDFRSSEIDERLKRYASVVYNDETLTDDRDIANVFPVYRFFFNLIKGTKTLELAATGNRKSCYRNFIKKFQFPHPYSKQGNISITDSIDSDNICHYLAPFRVIISLLFYGAINSKDRKFTLTKGEIQDFVFLKSSEFEVKCIDYFTIIKEIEANRNVKRRLTIHNINRLIAVIQEVLPLSSSLFSKTNDTISLNLDVNAQDYDESLNFIFEVLHYNKFWNPKSLLCDSNAKSDYSKYLDINGEDTFTSFVGTSLTIQEDCKIISSSNKDDNKPLQQIYFGAPGTSKSTTIKKETEDKGKEVHRITFHPDTDYSNFVGCYKPTKTEDFTINSGDVTDDLLVNKLKEYTSDETLGIVGGLQKFSIEFAEYLLECSNTKYRELLTTAGLSEKYDVEIAKYLKLYRNLIKPKLDSSSAITYEFVAQTFTKAYVSAWKQLNDKKEVFLVIEEINRGNCAQIFGDLFQLLDRNKDGYSDYAIEPDSDLQKYLKKEFEDADIPAEIKSGKKMLLPPNLFIWATMNTSDQSLFPIDSAFKRRWDWKYLPIKDEKKGHVIRIGNKQYDWWEFLDKMNARIEKLTLSEDKQLGYWFVKADDTTKEISLEKFVSKVVFYLWNDVFKDFGQDVNSPFMIKGNDGKVSEKLRFRSFFDLDGKEDASVAVKFIEGIGVEGHDAAPVQEAKEEELQPDPDSIVSMATDPVTRTSEQVQQPSGNDFTGKTAGILRITFEDGYVCDGSKNNSDAFMDALQHFVDYGYSVEDMIALNLTLSGHNMINAEKIGGLSERALGNYWVQTKQPISMKKTEIEKISQASGIGTTVEIIKDFAQQSVPTSPSTEVSSDEIEDEQKEETPQSSGIPSWLKGRRK